MKTLHYPKYNVLCSVRSFLEFSDGKVTFPVTPKHPDVMSLNLVIKEYKVNVLRQRGDGRRRPTHCRRQVCVRAPYETNRMPFSVANSSLVRLTGPVSTLR